MKPLIEKELFEKYATSHLHWLREPIQHDRLSIIKEFLSRRNRGYVLDNGCGEIEPLLISNNKDTIGLDIAKMTLLRLKAKAFKGELVLGSAVKLPFKDEAFERAICSEVIEHFAKGDEVLKCIAELNRIAKQYLLTTPNCGFGADWYALSYSDHKRFFSIKKLRKLLPPSTVYRTSIPQKLFPYFIRGSYNKLPLARSVLTQHGAQPFSIALFIFERFVNLDYRLQKTTLGKALFKLKQKIFGGAFIIAIVKKGS